MMMMSEYLFPDAVVVAAAASASGGVMMILLPLMVMTTVMEEQHDNFEAATMLPIRAYQLGSASCMSLSLKELSCSCTSARFFCFCFPFSLFFPLIKRELLLVLSVLIASVQNNYAGHHLL